MRLADGETEAVGDPEAVVGEGEPWLAECVDWALAVEVREQERVEERESAADGLVLGEGEEVWVAEGVTEGDALRVREAE